MNKNNYRPEAVMHMVPAMIRGFCRFGNVLALDVQDKIKNTLGWGGCFPAGNNNYNKLQNFFDSPTISETVCFTAWLLRSMCEISGRPLELIIVIAVDGKLNEPSFRLYLPGKFEVLVYISSEKLFHYFISIYLSYYKNSKIVRL